MGRAQDALNTFRQDVAVRAQVGSQNPGWEMASRDALANFCYGERLLEEAERESLAIIAMGDQFPGDAPRPLQSALLRMAQIERGRGHVPESLAWCDRALAVGRTRISKYPAYAAPEILAVARELDQLKHTDRAVALTNELLGALVSPEQDRWRAESLLLLAQIAIRGGRSDDARTLAAQAVDAARVEARSGERDGQRLIMAIGVELVVLGDCAAAERALRFAVYGP